MEKTRLNINVEKIVNNVMTREYPSQKTLLAQVIINWLTTIVIVSLVWAKWDAQLPSTGILWAMFIGANVIALAGRLVLEKKANHVSNRLVLITLLNGAIAIAIYPVYIGVLKFIVDLFSF